MFDIFRNDVELIVEFMFLHFQQMYALFYGERLLEQGAIITPRICREMRDLLYLLILAHTFGFMTDSCLYVSVLPVQKVQSCSL